MQWERLREERFVMNYALGLATYGYREPSTLEIMAYDIQADFEKGGKPFDIESVVKDALQSQPWYFVI